MSENARRFSTFHERLTILFNICASDKKNTKSFCMTVPFLTIFTYSLIFTDHVIIRVGYLCIDTYRYLMSSLYRIFDFRYVSGFLFVSKFRSVLSDFWYFLVAKCTYIATFYCILALYAVFIYKPLAFTFIFILLPTKT